MLITFFNQGDRLTPIFKPQGNRANFFWYHDSFYSHVSIAKQDRYLHLFVRNPDDASFGFMQGNQTWEDIQIHYSKNKPLLDQAYGNGKMNPLALNPPILRSDTVLIPDLIFDFETEGSNEAIVVYPTEHYGVRCRLFDSNHVPIPFIEVPEIIALIPNIRNSSPFKEIF